jgi:hypothetical protein
MCIIYDHQAAREVWLQRQRDDEIAAAEQRGRERVAQAEQRRVQASEENKKREQGWRSIDLVIKHEISINSNFL